MCDINLVGNKTMVQTESCLLFILLRHMYTETVAASCMDKDPHIHNAKQLLLCYAVSVYPSYMLLSTVHY